MYLPKCISIYNIQNFKTLINKRCLKFERYKRVNIQEKFFQTLSPFSIGVFLRAGGKFRAVFFTEHAQLKKSGIQRKKKLSYQAEK